MGETFALIDKCFMVCSIVQRRIKLLYYVLLVEGETGPVKNKEFRKVAHHLADDPKGVEGTLIQYLGKF